MRKVLVLLVLGSFLISLSGTVNSTIFVSNDEDLDPLVDVSVTVDIHAIRFLEEDAPKVKNVVEKKLGRFDGNNLFFKAIKRLIDQKLIKSDDPSLYLKVLINDNEFTSDIWTDTKYIYDMQWSATLDVPDDQEFVDITIQLWNSINEDEVLCDLSADPERYDVNIQYSIKTGHWTGDDQLSDASGYGRLCGCDDGTIYQKDRDCELWFDIYQNDYDSDGIPYWMEVNTYGTDPEVKNSGDPDGDKIPVDWEWKWGYNPFEAENHEQLDPDDDSIDNYEEYLTSEWFSDPFRIDVFVELDMMGDGPNGEKVYFPENSEELLNTAFNRQNFVFHLDYGDMGGHEIVPFDSETTHSELRDIYEDYFLHGDKNNWRRGIFHYGLVTYDVLPRGYMFRSNAFQIASLGMEEKAVQIPTSTREIVYASCYMHELGHTFAFNPIPGHNQLSQHPWQIGWWISRPYKSCMNYAWTYRIVDYSDGSNPSPDRNDWDTNRLKLDAFEREWN